MTPAFHDVDTAKEFFKRIATCVAFRDWTQALELLKDAKRTVERLKREDEESTA